MFEDSMSLLQVLAACDRALMCCHFLWFPIRAEDERQLQGLMCQYSSICMETLQLQFSFHLDEAAVGHFGLPGISLCISFCLVPWGFQPPSPGLEEASECLCTH